MEVTVSSLNVTGPEAVSVSAIVLSSYDIPTDRWNIQLRTFTKRPYKLSSPNFGSIAASLSSRYIANSLQIAESLTCNSNNNPCTQTISFQLSGCQSFSGVLALSTTPVKKIATIIN